MKKYIRPEVEPQYDFKNSKNKSRPLIFMTADRLFSAYGLILTFVYALMLFFTGLGFSWQSLAMIIWFWLVLTYLALPRLHRLMTLTYLPDYFMARTKTGDGLLGDPVNLAFDGDEEDIHNALRRAGWTMADPITLRSSLGIALSTIMKKSYAAAPVSDLYLFGRKQDFAYQREVDGSAAKRHHVRFWKVDEGWKLPGGEHVQWLAAATFDKGVGLSTMTWQITHKIDSNVDKERDYLIETLLFSDENVNVKVIEDFSSPYHDRNGGGDAVYTDGNLPVVDVKGAGKRAKGMNLELPQFDILGLPADNKVLNKELPPSQLNFVGVVIALEVLLSFVMLVTIGLNWKFKFGVIESKVVSEACFLSAGAFFHMVMYILTLKRYKWARLLLLISVALSTTVEMIDYYMMKNNGFWDLAVIGVMIVLVLALSSPVVRQWVYQVPTRSGNNQRL